jgi:GGDEF domain-containing protein
MFRGFLFALWPAWSNICSVVTSTPQAPLQRRRVLQLDLTLIRQNALPTRSYQHLHNRLKLPMRGETLGVSVGVAFYPRDGQDGESSLKAADAALYRVKRTGGGIAMAA